MTLFTLILMALGLGLIGWLTARGRAWSLQSVIDAPRFVSRPNYHGWYVAIWIALPLMLFALFWSFVEPQLVLQSVLASPEAENLPEFGFARESHFSRCKSRCSGAK